MSTLPKKPYEIADTFWHDGVLRKPGMPDLQLVDPEAKYLVLGGHVRERRPEPAPAATEAATEAIPPKKAKG